MSSVITDTFGCVHKNTKIWMENNEQISIEELWNKYSLLIKNDMKAIEAPNVNTVLRLFKQLPRSEQIVVAEKIGEQTFKERWKQLDETLPDVACSEQDIMKEVRAVRYGKRKGN